MKDHYTARMPSANATFACALKTRRASSVPGDKLFVLTADAADVDGRVWRRGTTLRHLSGGHDNVIGTDVLTVTIIREEGAQS